VERILDRLLTQAYLFDDPSAYEAGVRDAAEAIAAATDEQARIVAGKLAHPASGSTPRLQAVGGSAA